MDMTDEFLEDLWKVMCIIACIVLCVAAGNICQSLQRIASATEGYVSKLQALQRAK